jgi:hypothetical protein
MVLLKRKVKLKQDTTKLVDERLDEQLTSKLVDVQSNGYFAVVRREIL